ncbi:hypothetical protein O59_000802 [Cellvibrio sp. BR]|uniref:hypothetical protein n=1 Tax=Cellvibrio sp. BR TaxID=1134474 RepID=UPI0002601553|nr:hypothetical protein [Cellvibrio sp. BR]EIK46781.1 hypothetical protein O59_000802 [Cellvibrio sp. BR]
MKDFFESVFGAYKSRYQNKFIGTFVLFYMALNWERVIAVFFLSEFSYQRFIFLWSMDLYELAVKVSVSALLTLVYLFFSPLASLLVHKMQSYALTEYKIQNIKNEKRIIKEKEKLEDVKTDLLVKERDNFEMEAGITSKNRDISVYNKLISFFNEQKLRELFYSISDLRSISMEKFDRLRKFIYELAAVENMFYEDELNEKRNELLTRVSEMASLVVQGIRVVDGYSFEDEQVDSILKYEELVVDAYREFILEARNLFDR